MTYHRLILTDTDKAFHFSGPDPKGLGMTVRGYTREELKFSSHTTFQSFIDIVNKANVPGDAMVIIPHTGGLSISWETK
jgi:hypothetical protein